MFEIRSHVDGSKSMQHVNTHTCTRLAVFVYLPRRLERNKEEEKKKVGEGLQSKHTVVQDVVVGLRGFFKAPQTM